MVITYEDSEKAVRALYTLRESRYEEKHLLGNPSVVCIKIKTHRFNCSHASTQHRAFNGAERGATAARVCQCKIRGLSRSRADFKLQKTPESLSSFRSGQRRTAARTVRFQKYPELQDFSVRRRWHHRMGFAMLGQRGARFAVLFACLCHRTVRNRYVFKSNFNCSFDN